MKFITNLFSKCTIGFAVLKPFANESFSSDKMTPRYDANGKIYALICEEVYEASVK